MFDKIPYFPDASVSQDIKAPVVATAAFAPGQIIFQDELLVSSVFLDYNNSEDNNCEDCQCKEDENDKNCEEVCEDKEDEDKEDENNKAVLQEYEQDEFSAAVLGQFDELMSFCEKFHELSMVDRRKNLFKLLHRFETAPETMATLLQVPVPQDVDKLYLSTAKEIREAFPSVIPVALDDAQVAHLIGVIDCKYHMLVEEIDEAGIAMYVGLLAHSCRPNCSLTNAGEVMWVTAIQPIAPGELLTLDRMKCEMQSLKSRRQYFLEEHITCSCDLCSSTVPDLTRSFKCQSCSDGIVHPVGNVYSCVGCQAALTADQIADVVGEEDDAAAIIVDKIVYKVDEKTKERVLIYAPPLEDLDKALATSKLHRFHNKVYWEIEELTSAYAILNQRELEVKASRRAVEILDYTIPYVHEAKIQHYDSLAQTLVVTGDIDGAREMYTRAFSESTICSGAEYHETLLYKRLVDNTPTTKEDMLDMYGVNEEPEDEQAP